MELNKFTRVGDVVKENFRAAQIFDKNKIDFCCGGGISIEEACKKSNTNPDQLLADLELIVHTNDPDSKYMDSLGLDELSDYIVRRHHSYVVENIPFLLQKLDKLCNVHGANHAELFEINRLFSQVAENLTAHLQKEEQILFPFIKQLVNLKQGKVSAVEGLGTAQRVIDELDEEHTGEGNRYAQIARLSADYTCPPDGCNTYRVTFQTLGDFEKDLHRHIHLENNILFVKAVALEKEMIEKQKR